MQVVESSTLLNFPGGQVVHVLDDIKLPNLQTKQYPSAAPVHCWRSAKGQLRLRCSLYHRYGFLRRPPIGLLLSAICTGKTLILLGIKEPSRKKPYLSHTEQPITATYAAK